ncbi:MAG: prolipoprotein diacylglyceryl transferase [Oscillospiraceae bacterium]
MVRHNYSRGFAGAYYGLKSAARYGLNPDKMLDVILVATPAAILSARAYYVIFDGEKLDGIKDFFGFGNSSGFAGLAIYGGVIGAFVSGGIMCYIRKVNILNMFDVASAGFLIGQGIGRWGNFVNQEAYGAFTGSSWWGMQSDKTISEMGEGLVHPCFLYESIWCLAGFFVLNHFSKKRKFSGEISLMYCVWYGFGRGIIELLRTDSLMIGNIKVSCLLSFAICITGAVLLVVFSRRAAEKPSPMITRRFLPITRTSRPRKYRRKPMSRIIDGKAISAAVKERIRGEVSALSARGITVGLAVIIVGENPAYKIYVANKKKACEALGIVSEEYALPESTTEQELLELINTLNNKKSINGILCQLLPKHLDEKLIINSIAPEKDVDAFNPYSVGRIMIGDYDFVPARPRA